MQDNLYVFAPSCVSQNPLLRWWVTAKPRRAVVCSLYPTFSCLHRLSRDGYVRAMPSSQCDPHSGSSQPALPDRWALLRCSVW